LKELEIITVNHVLLKAEQNIRKKLGSPILIVIKSWNLKN